MDKYEAKAKAMQVIDLVGDGRTISSACDQIGIGTKAYLNIIQNNPDIAAEHDEAVQRGTDALVDALLEIDRHPHYGSSDPKVMKVVSDNIKFVASKRQPLKYGDKIEVVHNVSRLDQIITKALTAAREQSMPAIERREEDDIPDAEVIEEIEPELAKLLK